MNLATLSALLRTLRHAGDGAAGPVERVAQVRRAAAEGETALPAATSQRDRPTAARTDSAHRDAAAAPAPTAGAAIASALDEASIALDLTRAGTLVSGALRARSGEPRASVAIEGGAPLAASARAPASEIARTLSRAITDSGLFYESHLERWSRREYPQAALAREPQAAWSAPVERGAEAARPGALPDAAAALLTRQLDVLDSRQVAWHGTAWPGQRVAITFEEARDDATADADGETVPGAAPRWRTRIALDLPSLGPVEASLALDGDRLDLALAAQGEDASARLGAARATLALALADSRIALARFAVAGPA